ncbi:MAG: hypothetical protein ACK41Q_11800, partial [Candidatus Brocadia sp.]
KANIPWIILDDVLVRMRAGGKGSSIFTFDDWKVRRSYKLSSVFYEIIVSTSSFIRQLTRKIIKNTLGDKTVSIIRNYRWRKRTYR